MTHLLIVGAGSVGKRHLNNFAALGCQATLVDPRADRRREAEALNGVLAAHATIEDAFAKGADYEGAVICSPTRFHVEQTSLALRHKLPVLLEKPVSIALAEAESLRVSVAASGIPLLLGYTWRWSLPLRRVRALLDQGVVGAVHHAHFHMSAHLADWHPWERYQDFFMASKEQGGGALLDESHWIDLMIWCFGMPTEIYGAVGKLSGLEIDSDDCVDLIAAFGSKLSVVIHLDLFGRPHERSLRFVGDAGTLLWKAEPNMLMHSGRADQDWTTESFDVERNDMFAAVAKEFLEVLRGTRPPSCTIDDGHKVMRVIEAVRHSSKTGQRQVLGTVQAQ